MLKKLLFLSLAALIFMLPMKARAAQIFFYHTDPAGTPLSVTNSSGAVVWKADYKPFGEEQSVTASSSNDRRFIGKEKDEETGLSYFGARYLGGHTGRFTSPDEVRAVDPIASKTNEKLLLNPQRHNTYAYALNNPYRYVDPDGRDVWDIGLFGYSAYRLGKEPSRENAVYLGLDTVGLVPVVPALGTIARVGKAVDNAIDASSTATTGRRIKHVYNSVKDAGGDGFVPIQNGIRKYKVGNKELLHELRKIEGGSWNKVYRDGFDEAGNRASQHYFQSKSGKIFDFAIKSGWSNK